MLGEWKDGKYYIEGLEYKFPDQPAKKDMYNYGLPKKQQKWRRITDHEKYDWSEGWEKRLADNPEQIQYLQDEIDRLYNGIWMLINGEPTYLNRYMYFFLNWYILLDTGEYPAYRDTSLYYYRFLEIVENSKLCTGHTLLKARRLGATSMIIARKLLKLITTRNKSFGITSKTGADAKDAFDMLVNAFQNLPVFLRPRMEGNTSPKQILSLREQASRITKDNSITTERKGLNNKALHRPTGMNTFDSGAYEEILIDESGKYPVEVPIDKYLQVVTKCVKKGARVTGKLDLPTTVNPPNLGGSNYRLVWDASDQLESDYLGQTKSGLYRIMIPAYCGFDGYIDEHGNSVIENPTEEQKKYLESTGECPDPNIGAKQYLENIRKSLEGDKEALQEEIRMNPFTADEVFESANNRCIFDLDKLIKREQELRDELILLGRNPDKDELGRRGWFIKMPNGKVKFQDDPKGLWYIHRLLPDSQANRFRMSGLNKIPTNEEFGAAGLDPIRAGDATVDKGSDACLIITSRPTAMDENSGIPVAMFLGRMENSNKFHEQIYNGLQYYGVKMLAERSPLNWLDYAEDNHLIGYLYGTKRSDGTEVKGIPNQQSETTKQEHAESQVLASHYDIEIMPFINIIRQRKSFDIKNRTESDCCMADGYSKMALKIPFKKKEGVKQKLRSFFPKGKITIMS